MFLKKILLCLLRVAPLIESSCPQYQRYLCLGICVSVYTSTYEDLKKGLGARTCLFCHFCLLFFQLRNTDL